MGSGRVDVVAYVVISFGLRTLVHCPLHELCNIMSIRSYIHFNDEAHMRNCRCDKWGAHVGYSVDAQGLRFPFFYGKLLLEQEPAHHRSEDWVSGCGYRGPWFDLRLDILFYHWAKYRFYTIKGQIESCCDIGDSKFIVKAEHLIWCQISRVDGLKQCLVTPCWKCGFDVCVLDMNRVQKQLQVTSESGALWKS